MNDIGPLRAYILDDEALAVTRLKKLLATIHSIRVVGSTTDPAKALKFLQSKSVDVLFLDIQMPGMNGFELLSRLPNQPLVIFTTAYDEYALKAFEVNSIDYLLKPIDTRQLDRAITKVARLHNSPGDVTRQVQLLLAKLAEKLPPEPLELPRRIGTRIGDRIQYIEIDKITHFFSEDKLTFAATAEGKNYIVDHTITELEQKLAAGDFVRISRSTLVNLQFVDELHRWFGGKLLIRIRDKNRTEISVPREKTAMLKQRLGL